ncbi:hypothetical protein E2C01_094582 [Portunus trituberculatus]|uniref:Uncharacterized protein n=1 Tax=Portunus trituberculatus TaxID=210409 RepID=A0A5B7K3J4_PORTR|nr:hypothetical protein [Portunus trituberculatus]
MVVEEKVMVEKKRMEKEEFG